MAFRNNKNYQDRFVVMSLWAVVHCIRLLMIVEPCHSAAANVIESFYETRNYFVSPNQVCNKIIILC